MGVTIGIDLGTTNSCAAIVENGKPRVISETGGSFTIPSMVAVDDKGNRLVGQPAKRQSLINPVNTIYGAKRLIGRSYHSRTMEEIKRHFTYDMVDGDKDDVLIKMAGEVYGLDEVSALILDKVRNTAQDILQEEVTSAVVTVPAYFNDRQRQAVKDAGKIAELEVLRIINEPTAAALAYGWGKHKNEKVAVYDLGGGTFDISLLEVRDNVYEVKATGGDTFLGGVDFDNRLIELVLGQFREKTGLDLYGDAVALQRVKDACERTKIDLSTKQEARLNIPYIAVTDDGPVNLDVMIKREDLESRVEDLIDKTLEKCREVIGDAGWKTDDIDDVLLVGGQTRMPLVARKVGEFFGKTPSKGVHPDEAVAIGAALMAYSMTAGADQKVTLIDVLPMSIGVMLAKDRFHKIFPRNTTIPNATSMVFTTSKDNQTQLKLKIAQGESEKAGENELLGEFVFSGIPPAPKGQARLEVILKLSPEGLLSVSAQDPDTKKWIETNITVTSGITRKTHKSRLIEKKEPPKKRAEAQAESPGAGAAAPQAPKPPPARPVQKQPPRNQAPAPGKFSEPAPGPSAPLPHAKEAQSAGPHGVKTFRTKDGRMLIKRDPVTGRIIRDTVEQKEEQQDESRAKQFKRYRAPEPPPSMGKKVTGFFKKLLGKS